nr:penicillin-binding protein activator LpoB [uncultured Rhodoferax sp.]
MKLPRLFLLGLLVAITTGCASTIQSTVGQNRPDPLARWAVLPIANNTDTPQAGLSAEAMVEHQLRALGVVQLQRYPSALSRDSLFEPTERKVTEEALAWAKEQGIRYALVGSVEEWRYKVGIDGEPAVGVTLQVRDLRTDQVLWSASGAKSGWSRQSLAAVAQSLLTELFGQLALPAAANTQ